MTSPAPSLQGVEQRRDGEWVGGQDAVPVVHVPAFREGTVGVLARRLHRPL